MWVATWVSQNEELYLTWRSVWGLTEAATHLFSKSCVKSVSSLSICKEKLLPFVTKYDTILLKAQCTVHRQQVTCIFSFKLPVLTFLKEAFAFSIRFFVRQKCRTLFLRRSSDNFVESYLLLSQPKLNHANIKPVTILVFPKYAKFTSPFLRE